MKRILKTTFLIALFAFALSSTATIHTVVAEDHHDEHEGANECHDPTETLMINTHDSDTAFDKTELEATKGACVMFMFMNTQVNEHDFTIIRSNGTEWTHLHLDNALDNSTGPAPGTRMIHLQMPDEDITFNFECTVQGHADLGMKGKLVVGEGSPSDDSFLPGFGFYSVFLGLFTLMIAVPMIRRRI